MDSPTEEDVLSLLRLSEAVLDGHFVLSSGLHSARYLQCALVLQYPDRAAQLGVWLADRVRSKAVDLVVGPALGGVIIAHEVARSLGTRAIFAERKQGVMALRRGFHIDPGQRTVLVEDVVTTGESLLEVAEIVRARGGKLVAVTSVVDRRPDRSTWPVAHPLISLLRLEIPAYPPPECPLCGQGVPVDAPGTRQMS